MRYPHSSRTRATAAMLSMLLFQALSGNASCQAQEKANVFQETQAGREIVAELQELGPVESNRKIRTTNPPPRCWTNWTQLYGRPSCRRLLLFLSAARL